MKCKCGKRKTESGLGQGYFDRQGFHYQCLKCFARDNPKYFKDMKMQTKGKEGR